MEKTVAKFRDFSEAEKSDREFYRKLSGRERLDILLQLSKHEPEKTGDAICVGEVLRRASPTSAGTIQLEIERRAA